MRFELFIAKKLRMKDVNGVHKSAVSTLNVATIGLVLAIIIIIMSVSIVSGFKQTIVKKISDIDSHIKITNNWYDDNNELHSLISYSSEIETAISSALDSRIKNVSLIGEIPCVLKTQTGFSGLRFKGVPDKYDLSFLSDCTISGSADITNNGILISKQTADKLLINLGDKVSVYFMDGRTVRVRRCIVNGIFNTDFEDYDKNTLIGNLKTLQSVGQWDADTASYIEINCCSLEDIDAVKGTVISRLNRLIADNKYELYGILQIATVRENNPAYFAWLDLLDTNIAVILGLMIFVACFSIIACLIIIILNRINTIGVLKALGATNRSIRLIFICLVMRIIIRSIIVGNSIAIALLLLQKHFQIIRLDPEAYFMSYVPVEFSPWLIALNAGFFIIALLSLLLPSFIITSVKPSKTIRFE